MDGLAQARAEEVGRGRRLGADKIVRHCLVRREEVSRMLQRRRRGVALIVPLLVLEGAERPVKWVQQAKTSKKDGLTSHP